MRGTYSVMLMDPRETVKKEVLVIGETYAIRMGHALFVPKRVVYPMVDALD